MTEAAIGVDVGGTKIAGAVIHPDGAVRDTQTVATPSEGDGDSSAATTLALVDRLAQQARKRAYFTRRSGG
ncbi:MAG: ROK family protein [Acidimicrobiaceae bacterium]|nr:ROK family protein [Acidimicrobiaceae bacterium]